MDKEQVKAIELQGIVRNQTKIGVQDGQCEDIMNLRFKDGSWRAAGKGKLVHTNGTSYEQMYIHTNVYHHLLGVSNGTLYWFANIDTDCVTFKPLATPVAITNVTGTVTIVQTGHLLTIIDEADNFEYVIFKTDTNKYVQVNTDANGKQTDRELYPFGQIHFNWSDGEAITQDMKGEDGWGAWAESGVGEFFSASKWWDLNEVTPNVGDDRIAELGGTFANCQGKMIELYAKATEKNLFTNPFLVCAAVKLYDGSYIYASNPVLIFPHQQALASTYRITHTDSTSTTALNKWAGITKADDNLSAIGYETIGYDGVFSPRGGRFYYYKNSDDAGGYTKWWGKDLPMELSGETSEWTGLSGGNEYCKTRFGGRDTSTVFSNGIYNLVGINRLISENTIAQKSNAYWYFQVQGCNLCITIDKNFLKDSDVFKSLCIFITQPSDVYYQATDKDSLGQNRLSVDVYREVDSADSRNVHYYCSANLSYSPKRRTADEIMNDLLNSPFYLLKEYNTQQLEHLINNPIVDLSSAADEGLLSNITQQDKLETESLSRSSYSAKVQYMYNGRLHIGNYTEQMFHGYPIDAYQLNNHSLKYKSGKYFKNTLPNLVSDYDNAAQYSRSNIGFYSYTQNGTDTQTLYDSLSKNGWFLGLYIVTTINSQNGEYKVVKYIEASQLPTSASKGDFQNYIESLDPLLFYPDLRATSMKIGILRVEYRGDDYNIVTEWSRTFELTPHPYLDMAYYADSNLKPIDMTLSEVRYNGSILGDNGQLFNWLCDPSLATSSQLSAINEIFTLPQEKNLEYYPNGLKVSKTDNPLYFPSENTYLVGSAEIIALMSNAVAIGTGQTGAAPLYVFCKDGIYALLVDEKGEMAYTNSRIIARDVCNNAKSVTPIDTGVVFTTDRGLMEIAGSEVQEIGQKAEGDVFDYNADSTTDKAKKIMYNAFTMRKLADLPEALLDNVDFLTFLKGSIINYNHNERELMVSNPDYDYSYIMDRNGDWSRRDIAADEYVNNYPTSYRVQSNKFYKVDEEETGRDTADNSIYAMSQVVKLDSIGFKELHRVIARGYFETLEQSTKVITSGDFFGADTGNAFITVKRLYSKKDNINLFGRDINELIGRKFEMYVKNTYGSTSAIRFGMAIKTGDDETVYGTDVLTEACSYGEEKTIQFDFGVKGVVSPYYNATSIYLYAYSGDSSTPINTTAFKYSFSEIIEPPYLGLYLFGSYDGRKWALLGHREKQGKFTDIGTLVERTDCKFFRFVLAGQITKDSRLDYFEVSSNPSKLNTKIR